MAKKTSFEENIEELARKEGKNKLLLNKKRKGGNYDEQHIFIHNHVDDWSVPHPMPTEGWPDTGLPGRR